MPCARDILGKSLVIDNNYWAVWVFTTYFLIMDLESNSFSHLLIRGRLYYCKILWKKQKKKREIRRDPWHELNTIRHVFEKHFLGFLPNRKKTYRYFCDNPKEKSGLHRWKHRFRPFRSKRPVLNNTFCCFSVFCNFLRHITLLVC